MNTINMLKDVAMYFIEECSVAYRKIHGFRLSFV